MSNIPPIRVAVFMAAMLITIMPGLLFILERPDPTPRIIFMAIAWIIILVFGLAGALFWFGDGENNDRRH